ncbi:MAG: sigma-70 family RNA polymerase sigma factor [Pigmentiphaga sp.]|uniref:sigma-70 family RNA polymerase sigma factor n=1 Tax=Pigmentiphaga sp. TaxID=1977564 RepID=UPI0029AB6816|nr:sigma-70 family RNA polymerase sigma factor [Pigmentiphaga sp.]MDX3906712.1 sigma-70 family RNA polymerase sigma factor [Pigmentiphaga sp.]
MSASRPIPSDVVQALYSDHRSWLHQWLRRRLGCAEAAADLTQDTFVRLLSTRAQLGLPRLNEPRAYLTTIAHGLLVDFFRRAELERAWLADLASAPEPVQVSPETRLLVLETLLAIDRMLDGLPAKARTAWVLNRLDGLAHADIAARLGVSVSRVRQYLATAARHCYRLRFGAADADADPAAAD